MRVNCKSDGTTELIIMPVDIGHLQKAKALCDHLIREKHPARDVAADAAMMLATLIKEITPPPKADPLADPKKRGAGK